MADENIEYLVAVTVVVKVIERTPVAAKHAAEEHLDAAIVNSPAGIAVPYIMPKATNVMQNDKVTEVFHKIITGENYA